MAYYCYYLYSTDVTPAVAEQDFKGVVAWAVVSVVGAMLLLGGRASSQPDRETRRDTPIRQKTRMHELFIFEPLFVLLLFLFVPLYHGGPVASLAVPVSVAVVLNLGLLLVGAWWDEPAAGS
jgi:hypothetical protein